MVTRQEQKEQRRLDILVTAMKLFIRRGYVGTKISDIAEAAGMSTGLMFHYFESKEKLYEELVRLGLSAPQSILSETDGEPLAFFEEAAQGILDSLKSSPLVGEMFVLMGNAYADDTAPEGVKKQFEHYDIYGPTTAVILRGQADGTIRDGDPHALGLAFWSAIQGIAEELALHPDSPCPDPEWIVDILRKK